MSSRDEISLTDSDLQEMLAASPPEPHQRETRTGAQAEGNEVVWTLNQPFGQWSNHSVHLRDGLDLTVVEWDFQQNVSFTVDVQMQPLFGFNFCVAGEFLTQVSDAATDLVVRSQDTHTGFFQGDIKTTSKTAAGQKLTLVQMAVAPRLLETLANVSPDCAHPPLNQIFSRTQAGFQWRTQSVTPAMTIALHQILQCPYQGLTKQIYLESKVLELVALQLDQLSERPSNLTAASGLKSDDVERIHLAKDILIRDLENPPSLLTLAKQSGINSLKLKQGFRQIFKTTVFGYLHAYRMEEARRLLALGDWNVTQVAQAVGYAHPGKFAAAFKKKFGIMPKALKAK